MKNRINDILSNDTSIKNRNTYGVDKEMFKKVYQLAIKETIILFSIWIVVIQRISFVKVSKLPTTLTKPIIIYKVNYIMSYHFL